MIPARYQVHRQMINFLQYLLTQPSESLLNRMYMTQKENPSKGDWVSKVAQLLIEYEITLNMDEIQFMKPRLFKVLVKRKIHQEAFRDLVYRKNNGQKGCKIQYEKLDLAAYLTSKSNISVKDKLEMFAYRSEMNELPCNYGNKTECEMGCNSQIMNNEHLLNCPQINGCENTMNLTQMEWKQQRKIEGTTKATRKQHKKN